MTHTKMLYDSQSDVVVDRRSFLKCLQSAGAAVCSFFSGGGRLAVVGAPGWMDA